jgi:hypothetical protein
MAFHGGAAPTKRGMKDQTSTNIARDGAAKRPQSSFPTTHGMRKRSADIATGPAGTSGPDGGAVPSPLDARAPGKRYPAAAVKWGMKDPMGHSLNGNGPAVLNEGALTGR